ncbi:macro domain-containing protein [bacterium]|nr:MAG: macro domain-containing protein [bacterium]
MNKKLIERKINDVEFIAVLGDITDECSDVIVNAANSNLAHGGGIAGAIVRKGGNEIIVESRQWVKRNGIVPAGNVALTSGGKLKTRYIIHAVGPRWGEGDEEEKLRNAVINSLKKADKLGCSSISIPAISTGIFGFPKELGVKIITEETRKFILNSHTSIRTIRFCAIDSHTAKLFRKEIQSWTN